MQPTSNPASKSPVISGNLGVESARGSIHLFAGAFSSTLINGLGLIVIARLLGAKGYGIYTLSTLPSSVMILLIDLGVNIALTAYCARLKVRGDHESISTAFRTALTFNLALSIVAFLTALIFSRQLSEHLLARPELTPYVKICLATIILQTAFSTLTALLLGMGKTQAIASLQLAQALTKNILAVALILSGLEVLGAVIGYVAGYGFTVALALTLKPVRALLKPRGNDPHIFSLSKLKQMVAYGIPVYGANILNNASQQYQRVILANYASDAEVGGFSAVVNFSALVGVFTAPIATSLLPSFSKSRDTEEAGRLFRSSLKYLALIVLPITMLIMLNSKDLIELIYGPGFSFSSTYLSLYSLTFLLYGLGAPIIPSLFNGLGYTRRTLEIALTGLTVIIPSALLLASAMKVPGLITAIILSQLASLTYGLWTARKHLQITFQPRSLFKIYLAALLSAVLVFLIPTPYPNHVARIVLTSSAYLVAYAILAPVTGALKLKDLDDLAEVFNSTPLIKPLMNLVLNMERAIIVLVGRQSPD